MTDKISGAAGRRGWLISQSWPAVWLGLQETISPRSAGDQRKINAWLGLTQRQRAEAAAPQEHLERQIMPCVVPGVAPCRVPCRSPRLMPPVVPPVVPPVTPHAVPGAGQWGFAAWA